jgi:hypothetical protein
MTQQELLVFEVSGIHFAISLALVEEVVPASVITAIPRSPPFFLGLAAARGKVVGVIDAAQRYRLSPSLGAYFLVCQVRGNATAVTIDRPVLAGSLTVRELPQGEVDSLRERCKVDSKFVSVGFEIFECREKGTEFVSSGIQCLLIDPDLFVSAEMASQVGEVA